LEDTWEQLANKLGEDKESGSVTPIIAKVDGTIEKGLTGLISHTFPRARNIHFCPSPDSRSVFPARGRDQIALLQADSYR